MKEQKKFTRREFLKVSGMTAAGVGALSILTPFTGFNTGGTAVNAAVMNPVCYVPTTPLDALVTPNSQGQVPLPAASIPQFQHPLPILSVTGRSNGTIQTIIAGTAQINLEMREFKARMLPPSLYASATSGTWVWGFVSADQPTGTVRDTFTGPVVVATRGTPTQMKFVNNLGTTSSTHALAYLYAIDQSLHWANPNMIDRYVPGPDASTWYGNPDHYSGPIPAAVHLHGAEDPAAIDGGPESWFLSDGSMVGKAFYSKDGTSAKNYCIYRYPNVQEASPLWFHDHTLGATRLNVYMGLAGAYLLIDTKLKLPVGLTNTGVGDIRPGDVFSPSDTYDDVLIPLVIQNRMFDTNGQLYFPSGPDDPAIPSLNPEHEYWTPEFLGEQPNVHDTICVNGKVWPYLDVPNERQRFLLINGSNARSYILSFKNSIDIAPGYTPANINSATPKIWQISTDQGYLDTPVPLDYLIVMPGERAGFIVDFGGLEGKHLVLHNFGTEVPLNSLPLDPADFNDPKTTGKVMEFRVSGPPAILDTHYNPASGIPIRADNQKILRLVNPATGTLAASVTADLTRSLTLNELAHDGTRTVNGYIWSGGPLEILVNNTKWMGLRPDETMPNEMGSPPLNPVNGGIPDGIGNWLTELPKEGNTEIWEIINMTMDAHPIHTHLAQFQLMNRQAFNMGGMGTDGYWEEYIAAFGGSFKPAYGPPLGYAPSQASGGKYGGNPDVKPFLTGSITPPLPNEAGWKDTVRCPPGMVTRFVVRWAPTDINILPSQSSALRYDFKPNDSIPGVKNGKFDYVWHCHIVDHEDNEMMRPNQVIPNPQLPDASRKFKIGSDY
jgi:spore coat protein A, manganese oxidase